MGFPLAVVHAIGVVAFGAIIHAVFSLLAPALNAHVKETQPIKPLNNINPLLVELERNEIKLQFLIRILHFLLSFGLKYSPAYLRG